MALLAPAGAELVGRRAARARPGDGLGGRAGAKVDVLVAGLSRAEPVMLTELLLSLDPAITLILIEPDMDVALRAAEWVTMMHDGRVIVEGTPAEIRADELIHGL